jgi:hypothetical protein
MQKGMDGTGWTELLHYLYLSVSSYLFGMFEEFITPQAKKNLV